MHAGGGPGAARGHPWGPKGAPSKTEWKKGDKPPPPGHLKITHFAELSEKMNFERFVGAPVRNTRFCRKITGKGSTQDGGNVVIYKVESKK